MRRVFSIILALVMVISISACGSSGRADEALVGKYIAVTGTSMGMTLSGEDMAGFTLDLKSGGKVTMDVEGSSTNGKWVNDDTTITLTIENTEMVGKLGEDTIIFEGILKELVGISMDLKFAKEGTDAAKPENFLPDEEKALLGDWVGTSVTDALDEDVSGEISPDAMRATLNADHTCTITYQGEEIAKPKWSYYSGMVNFEGDVSGGASLYGDYKDDAFMITYSGDNYYKFTMSPSK